MDPSFFPMKSPTPSPPKATSIDCRCRARENKSYCSKQLLRNALPTSHPTDAGWHTNPTPLANGRSATDWTSQGSLRVLTPNTGKLKTVVENATYGRYLASGYLVYYQGGTLFAAPMDAGRLELTGPAVPLVDGVSYSIFGQDFDLSASGTLVYRRGTA